MLTEGVMPSVTSSSNARIEQEASRLEHIHLFPIQSFPWNFMLAFPPSSPYLAITENAYRATCRQTDRALVDSLHGAIHEAELGGTGQRRLVLQVSGKGKTELKEQEDAKERQSAQHILSRM